VSGNDPDPRKSRPLDSTQAYVPPEAQQAPPLPANLPKIPGITLHFELARGGMGVVYSGRQDFLDRRVAVKLLSVELGGDSFVQRFQREAKILAGIKHPNIVACHMAGTTDDGQSYLVMEFIDGPSLKKWIADHGPVSVPATLRLVRATAQALAHAHSLGIIHRDVKPENILLETVTSTALDVLFPFTPKVVDLGLARANEGSASLGLTSPGSVMGTPATMSPEQYDEPDAVDFRSDIYGLGCAFYEMLVGLPAFRGKKLTEIVTAKRAPVAPNPCDENLTVPPAVGALVQSMLACHRDERPRSYKELDERLLELIETLATSRTRSTKKAPPPVVGEETEWGKGPMVRPSSVKTDKTSAKDPSTSPPKATPVEDPFAKAEQNQKNRSAAKAPSAGLLRTSEINFLAEGLDAPAGPAKPAFEELDATVVSKLPQKDSADEAGGAAVGAGKGAAKPNRTPLFVGIGAVLVLAVGGYALSGGGGDPGGVDPRPEGGGTTKPPKPPAPVIDAIVGAETKRVLKERFSLEAKVTSAVPKPMCVWTLPDELLTKNRQAAKIEVQLLDGLPGVVFDCEFEVNDGKGQKDRRIVKVEVGDFDERRPLIGFTGKPEWSVDEADLRWNDVSRGEDDYVSCQAGLRLRTLTTALDPEETYWEWSGKLTAEADEKTAPAKVGLRAEFGDLGYTIVCGRTGTADDAGWTMDAHPCRRVDGIWKPEGEPLRVAFPNAPDDSEEKAVETRGWFRLQRQRGQLIAEIGSSTETFAPGKPQESSPPTGVRTVTFDLPAGASASQLTLFVDQGIGKFRLRSR